MKRHVFLIWLAALVIPRVEGADAAKEEITKLQGTWVIEKRLTNKEKGQDFLREIVKITFKGNKAVLPDKPAKDGEKKPEDEFAFTVDPAKKPKRIDIRLPKESGKDDVAININGVYVLDGDNLKLAFNNTNRGTVFPVGYPADFDGKDRSTATILKRENAKDAKTDAELIQGAWVVVTGEVHGKPIPEQMLKSLTLVFNGDKIDIRHEDKKGESKGESTFKIDQAKKPKAIDFKGAERHPALGIYRFDGEILVLCWAEPERPRPEDFATSNENRSTLLRLKRKK